MRRGVPRHVGWHPHDYGVAGDSCLASGILPGPKAGVEERVRVECAECSIVICRRNKWCIIMHGVIGFVNSWEFVIATSHAIGPVKKLPINWPVIVIS